MENNIIIFLTLKIDEHSLLMFHHLINSILIFLNFVNLALPNETFNTSNKFLVINICRFI